MLNVEDPGGLLDDMDKGGISFHTYTQWVEFYQLRESRMREGKSTPTTTETPRSVMDKLTGLHGR